MRFRPPYVGETRIKYRFLWLPKTINNNTRWLERAAWVEQCYQFLFHYEWIPIQWDD